MQNAAGNDEFIDLVDFVEFQQLQLAKTLLEDAKCVFYNDPGRTKFSVKSSLSSW